MDALDGLKALEQIVETIGEQLDDLYQRRDIPQAERVTLHSLEWTLAKLNDDLHTMRYEERDLRLSVAAARTLDLKRLGDMSRIAKERDELRAQAERKPWIERAPRANVDKLYKRIPGDGIMVHKLLVGDDLPALYEAGWRYLPITPENELTKKFGELPAEPAPEPYDWQVGDEVALNGEVYNVSLIRDGQYFVTGGGQGTQRQLESCGYWLHRKASDLGIQQLTPRQVEISDSTGNDGEGQS
jgi:hypothetical protein